MCKYSCIYIHIYLSVPAQNILERIHQKVDNMFREENLEDEKRERRQTF